MNNWKDKAYELYFTEHRKINDIAKLIGKSRQSVSDFLNTKNIAEEKTKRKEVSKNRQRIKNKEHMTKMRKNKNYIIENALLKRQHIIDVNVLSRERHFNNI